MRRPGDPRVTSAYSGFWERLLSDGWYPGHAVPGPARCPPPAALDRLLLGRRPGMANRPPGPYRAAMELPVGTRLVAGALGTSGVVHLVRPHLFDPLIPAGLGQPRPWVLGSGVAELACAAGLVTGQRWAPAAATATLAVIWVGNLQVAMDLQSSRRPGWQKAAGWARLPLQLPMMRAAWHSPVR